VKITEEQYPSIAKGLLIQRGNMSLSNLDVWNAIL